MKVWRVLRWLIALALGALLVVLAVPAAINAIRSSVEIGEQGPDNSASVESLGLTGPVDDGEATAQADFVVSDATVGQRDAKVLEVTSGGTHTGIVTGFDLIEGNPECVASVELAASLLRATPGKVGVYPSALADTDGLREGDTVDTLIRSASPGALAVTDGTPGRLRWDVTTLYRQWAQNLAPPRRDLVLVIRPTADNPTQELRFAAAESDEHAGPTLVWSGTSGCGA